MAETLLHIDNLDVRQTEAAGGHAILSDVSLELAEGETLCLVGESGSGKTMTALSVMGLLPPRELEIASGSIRLGGKDLTNLPQHQLRLLRATRMAMIFQEPMAALNPVMTIGRQIDEVLKAHTSLGRAERRTRIAEMLQKAELSDIERIANSYPHQLSGGQRQRAMIAMALILRPRLLIADEPTSALDVRIQKQILDLMRRLQREDGTSILFITHDMGVVADIADRIAVMHQGRIVETGTLREVFGAPKSGHTRKLLAAVPSLVPRKPRAGASADIVLSAQSLSKTYRSSSWFGSPPVPAISYVDLTLRQGRTLGIVGESGSGKSTLARCLLRLVEPEEGRICLGATDIMTLPRQALTPFRRLMQIVAQDPYRSLNPRLPVTDIVTEGPVNFGAARDEAQKDAAEILKAVGLAPDILHAYPHQLSGGQRQRVALARALILKPRVLIADEAVSALDMSTQADILQLLTGLQKRFGLAMLFITHDLRVAAQICDEVAIMQDGRIVEQGKAAEILTAPRHACTRALIDAAPGRGWNFAAVRPADTNP